MVFADSSLPLGDKTYLSLSLWERLGEGLRVMVPNKKSILIPLPLGEVK